MAVTATAMAATTARGPLTPMLTMAATDTEATDTEAMDTDTAATTARGPLRLITDTAVTEVTDTDTATVTAGASKPPAPNRLIQKPMERSFTTKLCHSPKNATKKYYLP